jgi:hypothetical protein
MKTIKLLALASILTFTSCSSRNAKVATNNHNVPTHDFSNEQNWRDSEDAKFFGTMFVALF